MDFRIQLVRGRMERPELSVERGGEDLQSKDWIYRRKNIGKSTDESL